MIPAKRPVGRPRKHSPTSGKSERKRRQPKPRVRVQEVEDDQIVGHVPVAGRPRLSGIQERVNDYSESWETESCLADIIADCTEDKPFGDDIDAFSPGEAAWYRQQLRDLGPAVFSQKYVLSDAVPVKKMLTAFGIRPPAFLEGSDDDTYFPLLTLAYTRELEKRAKLFQYNTVDDAVALLKNSRNIVVLTGAGISTSLGIPDFRSKETGLYAQLEKLGLGINDPQEVFNINVFNEDPTIFYTVAKDILPNTKRFSPTHAFIALLQNQGKLLTNYSQNIDNLEANAGILPEKLVQCHGSFATATCQNKDCQHRVPGDAIFADIKAGIIPRCTQCVVKQAQRPRKRKRASSGKKSAAGRRTKRWSSDDDDSDGDYDMPEPGVMKPDITFFGEDLPHQFDQRLEKHDRLVVDLVIVIGTSLKVSPVSELVPSLPSNVPQIYISRTPVSHINFDIDLLGDCDVIVAELCRRAGWDLRHEMVPPDQRVDIRLEEGYRSRHIFTTPEQQQQQHQQQKPRIRAVTKDLGSPARSPATVNSPSSSATLVAGEPNFVR
ncbi:SIR2-domain-containing protein [Xylariomycetidae sp. FL2044]|nr:SIR2-domain-containing protein [Xylariomycetidae sp. FL2044]